MNTLTHPKKTSSKFSFGIRSFTYGLLLPLKSLKLLLSHKRLLIWSILPIFTTLILYSLTHIYIQNIFEGQIAKVLEGKWATSMIVVSKIILFILEFFTFSLTFSWTSNIFSCLFNDFLAEETELYCNPPLKPVIHSGFTWRLRLLSIDLTKSILAATLQLLNLFLSWIPGINLLAILFTFLIFSFQFMSYPQTRRGEGFLDGFHLIIKNFPASLGFGIAVSILFSIPLISCFFLPLAVIGGTLLYGYSSNSD